MTRQRKGVLHCWHGTEVLPSWHVDLCPTHWHVDLLTGISTSAPLTGTSTSVPLTGTSTSTSASAFTTGILSSDPQIYALLLELQTERDKRAALEVEVGVLKKRLEAVLQVESAADYQYKLCSEIDGAVSSQNILLHGPDC